MEVGRPAFRPFAELLEMDALGYYEAASQVRNQLSPRSQSPMITGRSARG